LNARPAGSGRDLAPFESASAMNFVIGLFLLFLIITAIKQFARLDAASIARVARHGGGILGMIGALVLLLRGRVGVAAALAGMAASFAGWRQTGAGWTTFRTPGSGAGAGRVSTARSAMIEMRLDHDSGVMTGAVLSGVYAGRAIETLSRPDLLALREELARDDPDGVKLLEAYLDRRFSGWRETNEGQREGRRSDGSAGVMTRREAYEVLGLPQGASAEDIIRSHRTLMKKFHPDHGGSTALAARVNQAKDVLMQRHG
jgi:DnaJ-like protein